MNKDGLAARLLATFLGELDEQVRQMNADLLALESAPGDAERLTALFRVAHTLKGAARAVGVPEIEDACHALETMLLPVRDGRQALGASQLALLFRAADALADAGVRLRRGEDLSASPIGRLGSGLDAADVSAPADTGNGPRPATAPAPPGAGASARPAADRPADRHRERPDPIAAVVATRPTPPAAASAPPAARPAASGEPAPPGGTVAAVEATPPPSAEAGSPLRVQADKLDALFGAAGQLSTAVGRVGTRATELAALADRAAEWTADWRRARRGLRVAIERAGGSPELLRVVQRLEDGARSVAEATGRVAVRMTTETRALGRAAQDTVDHVWRLRTRPAADAFETLPRVVRDLARASGKEVRLELRGSDVEADRVVLDGLREAVLHLVRNAIDHGIEPPAARERAGKPRQGTVRVSAATRGDRLLVEVADDGTGVDVGAVRDRLDTLGRPAPADDRDVARALFEPGMSTRVEATTISGRGVGLDLVRAAADRLGGLVDVTWKAGGGTTVLVECPVSLATLRGVVARVSGQTLVIPTAHVERLLRVRADAIRQAEGRSVLPTTAGPVPLVALARVLGPPLAEQRIVDEVPAVLIRIGARRLAVAVDELVAEQEVVVRPLGRDGWSLPHVSGAAVLETGQVALIVNPTAVVATGLAAAGSADVTVAPSPVAPRRSRVLVVDDSITTRTLEQSVLEAAGFDVVTAVDGADGWRLLQEQACDLVVADVEMPRMDGIALCRAIRASKRFAALPVVLVTALERPEHRAQGMDAGADAYIGKSGFDQQHLLETVRQLLD